MQQNILKNLLILLILIFNISDKCYANIEILFPSNNTIVFKKKVHIIVKADSKNEIVLMFRNKIIILKNFIKIKTSDGIFYIIKKNIILSNGKNVITLISGDKNLKITIFYKKAFTQNSRKIRYFHMNDKREFCKKCHIFKSSTQCKICHYDKNLGKYIHGPVAAWQCFVCHDKNNYFTINPPLSARCLRCHEEFSTEMYNAKYVHPPAVTTDCIICHSPHESENKFFINDNINKICTQCHEYKLSKFHILKKNSKNHIKLKCIKCHNPHYGESKFLFIKKIKKKRTLCLQCHRKVHGM